MKRIHLLCNAHIDPVWHWRWPEGIGAALSTFRCAADFCEEFDAFIFNHNEALLYQCVEEYEPALFERIRKLVAAGKWHIMGGWYLQPDTNMPAGESIIRQITVGQKYFQEKFGMRPTTAVSMDSFGHSKGLVQILQKAGYNAYVFLRPEKNSGHPKGLPDNTFCWEGYAGSQVIGHRLDEGYNTLYGTACPAVCYYADHTEEINPGKNELLRCWGVGDHGGGPSRKDLADLTWLIDYKKNEIEIIHSTPEAFIATLNIGELPRFAGDLNPVNMGCYTTMHKVKAAHRRLESRLAMAEKMAALCAMEGLAAYPTEKLQEAYADLLFSEFHDALPGTSIRDVESDVVQKLHHGLENADQILTKAFYLLAADEKPAEGSDIPLLVLNPHPFEITDTFECEFMLQNQNWDMTFTNGTVYAGDQPLPSQMVKEESNMPLDWRKKIAFHATLKPMSVNRFDCKLEVIEKNPNEIYSVADAGLYVFKNDRIEVALDTADGSVRSYRVDGVDYAGAGLGQLLVYLDGPNPWRLERSGNREVPLGKFALLSEQDSAVLAGVTSERLSPIRVVEDGEVCTQVEVLMGYGLSRARVLYKFSKHQPDFDMEVTVLWSEKDRLLRLNVPHAFAKAAYCGQDMFGVKPLEGEYELVAQKWVSAIDKETDRGLAVVNDSTYGLIETEAGVQLSMLRSAAYVCHDIGERRLLAQERFHPRMEQGEMTFKFSVLAGRANEINDLADRKAQIRNEEPQAVSFFPAGKGDSPVLPVAIRDVRLDVMKLAEDGQGYILRLFNYHETDVTAVIVLERLGIKAAIPFRGYELKTLRAENGSLREVDMLSEQ